jgi:hypothetical protein
LPFSRGIMAASSVVTAEVESAIENVQMILGDHGADPATVERQPNHTRCFVRRCRDGSHSWEPVF